MISAEVFLSLKVGDTVEIPSLIANLTEEDVVCTVSSVGETTVTFRQYFHGIFVGALTLECPVGGSTVTRQAETKNPPAPQTPPSMI